MGSAQGVVRGRGLRSSAAAGVLAGIAALALMAAPAGAAPASGPVEVKLLGNRADLVSGGDALVEVIRPTGTNPDSVEVALDGVDVTGEFALRDNGRFLGLLDLEPGKNAVVAKVQQQTATLEITDHPIGGPIFSGPHLKPWLCTTQNAANGLGPAEDEECNAPTRVDLLYQPQGGGALQPYDPDNPPTNVGTATTDEGEEVPFIVRRERGTMNRGIYEFSVLFDPDEGTAAWDPPPAWNGKVVWPFGAAAGTVHSPSTSVPVRSSRPLATSRAPVSPWLIATR